VSELLTEAERPNKSSTCIQPCQSRRTGGIDLKVVIVQHELATRKLRRTRRATTSRGLVVLVAALAAGTLAACSSSNDGGSPGSAAAAAGSNGKRIAVFQPTNTNNYTVTEIHGAVDAAKTNGYEVDVFDSEYDAAKQASQLRQAADSKRYAGFVVMASAAPGTICMQIKNALSAGIRVAMINQPACSTAETQDEYSSPIAGTSFTGWQSPHLLQQYFEAGFAANPSGGEHAVIAPPAAHQNFGRCKAALDAVASNYPQWKSDGFIPGDYLASTALAKTEALISAHANVRMIFSLYSGMSDGVYSALTSAGHTSVKIIDWVSEAQG
jgi:ABC-type sugar transport system substrate-binding protein